MTRHCEAVQGLDECISSIIAGLSLVTLLSILWHAVTVGVVYEGCGEVVKWVACARTARWTSTRTRSKCAAGLNAFHGLKNSSAPYWRRIASIFFKSFSLISMA
jgi:hypothetical protein